MKKRIWLIIPLILLITFTVWKAAANKKEEVTLKESQNEEQEAESQEEQKEEPKSLGMKIVLDPGHGGFDPGKVNTDGMIEKDINLQIALKLKEELEAQGIEVIMTRDSDKGLYAETSKSKKTEDLKNRCTLIEQTAPVCTISIHQNSFPDESVYGPQVFYYHTSEESAQLAQIVQNSLNQNLAIEKPREIKNNESYYMLKKSPSTTIIVECGFLSNPTEAQKLSGEEYQGQIAEAIRLGVMEYVTSMMPEGESALQKQG